MADGRIAPDAAAWSSPQADAGLDRLFLQARTIRAWQERPVAPALLRELYRLMCMGPTSANCQPARIVFVQSAAGKAALLPLLDAGNREQTRLAPVTAVLACDLHFHERLGVLYPHQPQARSWFTASPAATRDAALRNASLQHGYFIIAARALGLDCGPMGGFDADAVTKRYFPGGRAEVSFLCNLGYVSPAPMRARLPRLPFEEACALA